MAPLVLLHAHAGYGKTTCLESWQVVDPRPFAWLRCRPGHRDQRAFLGAVARALAEVRPGDRRLRAAIRKRAPDGASLRAAIEHTLGSEGEPFVLVFDDVHALARPRQRDLAGLIEALPAGSQIAVATRVRPALPLGRMRAEHRVAELGPVELALSGDESAAVLGELVPRLTRAQRQSLAARIEGWPAAIHLAQLALAGQGDLASAAAAFGGDDRAVADYVREEVLAGLSRDDLELLIQSSPLDALSGASCDAVLTRTGSARALRRLSRERALLIPLDRRDETYRLPPLLREMLRAELRRERPELETRLRIRTIRWHAGRGERERAIEHAVAADATAVAGELLWEAFLELSGRGRIERVASWLDGLGDERIAANVPLALVAAHCSIVRGESHEGARWARAAAVAAGKTRALRSRYEADLLLLEAALGADGVADMGAKADRAAELLEADDPWQSAACLYRGAAGRLSGQPERAAPLLEEAARRGSSSAPLVQVCALAQLALIALEGGDTARALEMVAHADEQIRRCGLEDNAGAALTYAVGALARAEEGQAQRAHALARRSEQSLRAGAQPPAWHSAEMMLVLAETWLRLDEAERAQPALRHADAHLARVPDAAILRQRLSAAQAGLDGARARHTGGDDGLTKAELRTLQYLPSHLSFREIGDVLCLSPNTVKTQSRAVYRKLGVSSRSAAVERARDAGLLAESQLAAGRRR